MKGKYIPTQPLELIYIYGYIWIYVYIYICMDIYIYGYIWIYIYMDIYVDIYGYIYIYGYIWIYIYMDIYIYTWIYMVCPIFSVPEMATENWHLFIRIREAVAMVSWVGHINLSSLKESNIAVENGCLYMIYPVKTHDFL